MQVGRVHADYSDYQDSWRTYRDVLRGDEAMVELNRDFETGKLSRPAG